MPTLFNATQFPVFVAALRKQLAPLEAIAVQDADVVERAVASGVLRDNTDQFDAMLRQRAEEAAQRLDRDAEEFEADMRKTIADEIATWHDEHDAPVEQVAEPDEVVERNPVVEHSDAQLPDPMADAAPEMHEAPEAPVGDISQRHVTPQGVEVSGGPAIELRSEGDPGVVA